MYFNPEIVSVKKMAYTINQNFSLPNVNPFMIPPFFVIDHSVITAKIG